MIILSASDVAAALPYPALINALRRAFASDIVSPQRTHHEIPVPEGNAATLLLMPAWRSGQALGVKIATVFPDNAKHRCPAVFASYFLSDGQTGKPLAVLDGTELTLRRTAAASALASSYLSRQDANSLLMIGTGNLAPHLIAAHSSVRQFREVRIWGRCMEKAEQLAARLAGNEVDVSAENDLENAVRRADVISCATLATQPLVRGAWLSPGQHLDLVGAFTPLMREADVEAISRADLYVDTRSGTLAEAGEIIQAVEAGAISASHIQAELSELARGRVAGRRNDAAITVFKSVGTALEDLAAAELAVGNYRATIDVSARH